MYIITILKWIISPQLSTSNLQNSLTYNSALDFSKYTILFHYETNSLNPSHVTKKKKYYQSLCSYRANSFFHT